MYYFKQKNCYDFATKSTNQQQSHGYIFGSTRPLINPSIPTQIPISTPLKNLRFQRFRQMVPEEEACLNLGQQWTAADGREIRRSGKLRKVRRCGGAACGEAGGAGGKVTDGCGELGGKERTSSSPSACVTRRRQGQSSHFRFSLDSNLGLLT